MAGPRSSFAWEGPRDRARPDHARGRRSQHPPDAGRAAPGRRVHRRGGPQRERRVAPGRRSGSRRRPARSLDATRARRPRHAHGHARPWPEHPGDHDEWQGAAHGRRARGQAGRLSISGEAAHARVGAGDRAGCARAESHPGGKSGVAGGARASLGAGRRECGHAAGPRAHRPGGADRGARPPDRGERHGEGAGRGGRTRGEPTRPAAPS